MIGTFNLYILLNTFIKISFLSFLKRYLYSWSLSLIAPGQVGDASFILLLKNKISVKHTTLVYLFDKIITLCFYCLITLFGFSIYLSINISYIFLFFISVSALSILILFYSKTKSQYFYSFIFDKKNIFVEIILNKKAICKNILGTILKILITGLTYYIAFKSFNVIISWQDALVIPIMCTLVGYIPISAAGIGTVEVSAVYIFSTIGISSSVVISVYILLRTCQFAIAVIVITFSLVFKKIFPNNIKE
ncbi:membrane hypothetical protein [Desulfamplus magnetovallimortis]|uniref:Uncharacterized protein n=2 Tax=Desulfamplus magnetovallimortis TaxID=1246637 RepID=A0A1W1HKZ7_9BACT|nr:membrane hypothetical protein [Desulfamplus magnetovallimortis]